MLLITMFTGCSRELLGAAAVGRPGQGRLTNIRTKNSWTGWRRTMIPAGSAERSP